MLDSCQPLLGVADHDSLVEDERDHDGSRIETNPDRWVRVPLERAQLISCAG